MTRRPRPQLSGASERKFQWAPGDQPQLEFEMEQLQPLDVDQQQANWVYVQQQQQQQVPLAAYLSSLYNLGAQESIELARSRQRPQAAAAAPQIPLLTREQLLESLGLISGRQLAMLRAQQVQGKATRNSTSSGGFLSNFFASNSQARWLDSPSSFVLMLALALMSTCFIVKLMMRKLARIGRAPAGSQRRLHKYCEQNDDDGDNEQRPWRPCKAAFWSLKQQRRSSSICSDGGECDSLGRSSSGGDLIASGKLVAQHGAGGKQLGEAPPTSARLLNKRKQLANSAQDLSTDSGNETIGTFDSDRTPQRRAIRNSLESLAERWARFMGNNNKPPPSYDDVEAAASGGGAIKRHCGDNETSSEVAAADSKGTFRTSTSYIRSLIEALTKATGSQQQQTTTTTTTNCDNAQQTSIGDQQQDEQEFSSTSSSSCLIAATRNNKREELCEQEVLMSQMDISAAHLILDYMEKHLIDKERLRREWLELNAGNAPIQPAGETRQTTTVKANQLVLQRLAKVALAEENRTKNRDLLVVPFDRNRVKLGLQQQQAATNGKRAASGSRPNDYINASFIYDDDPRRPTHIVAQGPIETTCAQFWQMIWEQEISVVVMLTRLNENGAPMCHCYWPTDSTGGISTTATPSNGADSPPSPPTGSGKTAHGQRGSVTSVFSGISHNNSTINHHHHHHQGGQAAVAAAIVASGEPNDSNVLVFEVPLASQREIATGNDDGGATKQRQSEAASMTLEVHLISEHVSSSDYLVRNMYLLNRSTGETRTISQFHYLAWPTGRTPDNVRNFLQFRRKVHKSYRNLKSPILVHCNDGAGRAGTYTLIDMTLERIKNGAKEIDLRATLEHLRDQRLGMCATQAQFEFVLVALAEEIQIILNALPQ